MSAKGPPCNIILCIRYAGTVNESETQLGITVLFVLKIQIGPIDSTQQCQKVQFIAWLFH